jgi:vanillate O-demethylase monooxygenase subunit
MQYPRHQWYVAVAREEIGRHLLRRKILGEEIVFYRTEDGAAVALSNWCPHRGFRLSDSRLEGDVIECGYHGIRFGTSGACVKIPAQAAIPSQMRVKSYPVVEKSFWVWIWMGEPERADPNLIPEIGYADDAFAYNIFLFCYPMNGNCQLLADNFLDNTHLSFLHAGVEDNKDQLELVATRPQVEITDTTIQITRTIKNFLPNKNTMFRLKLEKGVPVDRVLTVKYFVPSLVTVNDSYYDTKESTRVLRTRFGQAPITPANERSSYSFVAVSGTFEIEMPAYRDFSAAVMARDKLAIESAQAAYDEGGAGFREINVRQDEMSVRSRRLLTQMVARVDGPAALQ